MTHVCISGGRQSGDADRSLGCVLRIRSKGCWIYCVDCSMFFAWRKQGMFIFLLVGSKSLCQVLVFDRRYCSGMNLIVTVVHCYVFLLLGVSKEC